MRDLAEDLKICEAATPGPWEAVGQGGVSMDDGNRDYYEIQKQRSNVVIDSWGGRLIAKIFLSRRKNRREDAEFIAESREGWPEAIERAIEAEAEIELLWNTIKGMEAKHRELLGVHIIEERDKWRSEAELLRQQLAESEAGAAVMREALEKIQNEKLPELLRDKRESSKVAENVSSISLVITKVLGKWRLW